LMKKIIKISKTVKELRIMIIIAIIHRCMKPIKKIKYLKEHHSIRALKSDLNIDKDLGKQITSQLRRRIFSLRCCKNHKFIALTHSK